MSSERSRIASGVGELDRLLGGLYIGDNVVWHDDAGSLASVFCLNFIQASYAQGRPLIYVCFDRSPRNLMEKLGPLADSPLLTILDCFTFGKGAGSEVFLKFYEEEQSDFGCKIVLVENPRQVDDVTKAFYGVHGRLEGDVRFVFESLTGMQEQWGGEDHILNFYSHSCPRLYELRTIAYWILEKRAHTPRLRAQINQIAQVAIDLSVRRGKTSLTILKAEKRELDTLNKPYNYWAKDLTIAFDSDKGGLSTARPGPAPQGTEDSARALPDGARQAGGRHTQHHLPGGKQPDLSLPAGAPEDGGSALRGGERLFPGIDADEETGGLFRNRGD